MSKSTTNREKCHFTPRATLAATGLKVRQLGIFRPIAERVKIAQKVVRYTRSLGSLRQVGCALGIDGHKVFDRTATTLHVSGQVHDLCNAIYRRRKAFRLCYIPCHNLTVFP